METISEYSHWGVALVMMVIASALEKLETAGDDRGLYCCFIYRDVGWEKIYQAKAEGLVTDGIYAYIRHPQYTGIILATFGALIHWPTLLTFFLWPILIYAYLRLAKKEEGERRT